MKYRIVPEATPQAMDGDTRLARELNSLLTKSFIMSRDVPSDECLREATELIAAMTVDNPATGKASLEGVAEYLIDCFSTRKAKMLDPKTGEFVDSDYQGPQSIYDPHYSIYWDVAAKVMQLMARAEIEAW